MVSAAAGTSSIIPTGADAYGRRASANCRHDFRMIARNRRSSSSVVIIGNRIRTCPPLRLA
jgi:hypothetical protein